MIKQNYSIITMFEKGDNAVRRVILLVKVTSLLYTFVQGWIS